MQAFSMLDYSTFRVLLGYRLHTAAGGGAIRYAAGWADATLEATVGIDACPAVLARWSSAAGALVDVCGAILLAYDGAAKVSCRWELTCSLVRAVPSQ